MIETHDIALYKCPISTDLSIYLSAPLTLTNSYEKDDYDDDDTT